MMRFAVVIEKANGNYSAYVPCPAASRPSRRRKRESARAVRFHVEGLKEDGLPVPEPTSIAECVA
jgi:predicted RNase H-like HicB family nuclease